MIKSREEKLQKAWNKYFENIKKENELIRALIEYYKKVEPKIIEIVEKKRPNYEDDRGRIKLEEIKQKRTSINRPRSKTEIKAEAKDIAECDLRVNLKILKGEMEGFEKTANKNEFKLAAREFEPKKQQYERFLEILKRVHTDTLKLKPTITYNHFNSLYLENFKGFLTRENKKETKKCNTIKLRPITLIYGPNSYGKSSILQSLLLLNQTVNEAEDYKSIKLLSNGNMIKLGLFNEFLNKYTKQKEIKIELTLPYNHYFNNTEDFPQDTSILTKLSFCFHFSLKNEQIILPQIDIFATQIDYSDPHNPMQKNEQELLCNFKLKQGNESEDEIYEIENFNNKLLGNIFKNIENNEDENNEERFESIKKVSFFKLEDFLAEKPFEQLEKIMKDITYLSSYRVPPARYYLPENNRRNYVGKNGQYTAEILGYDEKVNDKVNFWLERLAGYKLSKTSKQGNVGSINLDDNKTAIKDINLIDLGSGITQVLPIITQAFKSEGDMILVEEPEIHLHPKAQAELGEMFADAVKCNQNNTFVIETHSENLLLRLEKMIRKKKLSKDDISIIYVDKDEKGSKCISLELDNEGNIINIDDVPGGFFDEGFNELFL